MTSGHLTIRIDFTTGDSIGPGKIELLEAIRSTGSITMAARSIGMSYRYAWVLVQELNGALREPVIEAQQGGIDGGHATLTPLGRKLVERYRAIEE